MDPQSAIELETELDVDDDVDVDLPDDISSDSEDGGEHRVPVGIPAPRAGTQTTPTISPIATSPIDIMDPSFLRKRMSQSNGTIFYQKRGGLNPAARSLKRSPTGQFKKLT